MGRRLQIRKETVRYMLVGCLTAAVNLSVYFISNLYLGINYLISNAVAWVATVAFAYVTNKLFVFRTRCRTMRELLREIALFVNTRLISGAAEQILMWVMVGVCCLGSSIIKLVSSAAAVAINFFVSKGIFKVKNRKRGSIK